MGVEMGDYFRFVLALVFVLALIGVLAALARRFNVGFPTPMRAGKARRLSVVEVAPIDTRRRLVLVRRDNTEHLILLGASSELLIESGIAAPATAAAPTEDTP